jgi:5'-nucleotidase
MWPASLCSATGETHDFEHKITIAVSARALFDFDAENKMFREDGPLAYCALKAAWLDVPASPGVAFPLVWTLHAFNGNASNDVEVAILSSKDPVSGLRVFTSIRHHGLRPRMMPARQNLLRAIQP